jgi:ABC-type antimicrobial peptide transport system permease subunit
VETLEQLLSPETRQWKAGATLFTLFGLLALSLATVGLYAVLAFDIVQRTRELGVRRVLGAGKARLLAGVAIECARLSGVGLALGLAVAYATSPLLNDLLFEVSPRDPGVFVGVALLLTAAATAGVLLPGFRATNVDATVALKAE